MFLTLLAMKMIISILAFYFLGTTFLLYSGYTTEQGATCQDERCVLISNLEDTLPGDCTKEPCTSSCDCICCTHLFNSSELMVLEDQDLRSVTIKLPPFQSQIEEMLSASDIWQPPKPC